MMRIRREMEGGENAPRSPCSLHWWVSRTRRGFSPSPRLLLHKGSVLPSALMQMLYLRLGYGPLGMLQLHQTHLLNVNTPEGQPLCWSRCKDLCGPRSPSKTARPHGHQGCHGCSLLARGAEVGGLPVVLMMQPQELQHQETPSSHTTPTRVSQCEH